MPLEGTAKSMGTVEQYRRVLGAETGKRTDPTCKRLAGDIGLHGDEFVMLVRRRTEMSVANAFIGLI